MADDKKEKKTLGLSGKGTLSLKAPVGAGGGARQGVAVGRSAKPVAVEVRKKRGAQAENAKTTQADDSDAHLSNAEREARARAIQQAQQAPKESTAPQYQTKLVIKNQPVEEEAAAVPEADAGKSPADIAREQEMAKMRKLNDLEATEKRKRDGARPAPVNARPAAPGFQNAKPSGRGKGDYSRPEEEAPTSTADDRSRWRRYASPISAGKPSATWKKAASSFSRRAQAIPSSPPIRQPRSAPMKWAATHC